MKVKKTVVSTLLALTIAGTIGFGTVTQTACNSTNNNINNEQTETTYFNLTLNLNGGELSEGQNVTQFEAGKRFILPTPTKTGYKFKGWYDNADFNGNAYAQIDKADATSDKEFWAMWEVDSTNSEAYTVILYFNGGRLKEGQTDVTGYMHGTTVILPILERDNYKFDGWYEDGNFSGSPVTEIPATAKGDKKYYAKWSLIEGEDPDVKPDKYTVTLYYNGGKILSGSDITSYTYGEGAILPILEKDGYSFDGWYESSTFEGNKVTEILKTDSGDKIYYAKWTPVAASTINVTSFGGYDEGAYVEVERIKDTKISDYTVSYKPSSGVHEYVKIDSELVREIDDGSIRADIVGISAGNYDIKVQVNNFTVEKSNIEVTAYDRSGYAHFKYSDGVGAYNDDGTAKNGAVIVYVTEETKNTVSLKMGNSTCVGIANILSKASNLNGTPLIVRILGTVGAATWKEINYDKGGNYNDGTDYDSNNPLPNDKVIGMNGKQLPQARTSQEDLIKGGYNELDESVYSELIGLSSVAKFSNNEYDSAWNNCSISNASNVTVEGIGTDARIFQWGFTWGTCNSIEVRNLTFEDYTEDACSFEGNQSAASLDEFNSKNIWVHHNTFLEGINYWDICPEQDKHEGDGATDFKGNANVTVSYNHYFENHKTGLVGSGNSSMSANFTFHHNWYEQCSSRLPLARQANMHMYNNLYDGTTGTNMSLRANAYAFIENCYFRNANNPVTTDGGYAKIYNCTFEGKTISSSVSNVTIVSSRTELVTGANIFGNNFDTNPNLFYYDSAENKSKVSPKHGRNEVLTVVPELSGVHKNK